MARFAVKTFKLRFRYPYSFSSPHSIEPAAAPVRGDPRALRTVVLPLTADQKGENHFIVTRFRPLPDQVTESNASSFIPMLTASMRRDGEQVESPVLEQRDELALVTFPDSRIPGGTTSRHTFILGGWEWYELSCQWSAYWKRLMLETCREIVRTAKIARRRGVD